MRAEEKSAFEPTDIFPCVNDGFTVNYGMHENVRFAEALLRGDICAIRDFALEMQERRRIFVEVEGIILVTMDLLRRGEPSDAVRAILKAMKVRAADEAIRMARGRLKVLG